jgi:hypothetical protein
VAANRQRAEVEIKGSDGTAYRFRLGTGAICRLEDTLDLDVMALFEKLQQGKIRLGMVREFVKVSAVDHPDMDNDTANGLIDDLGVVPVLNAMTDSILLTFNIETPAATTKGGKPNGAEAAPANPLPPSAKRRRGGADTSSAPPRSAH